MKRMRYPYRFKIKKFGKEGQWSYQLFLTQNRIFKEKIGGYSGSSFLGKEIGIVSYEKRTLIKWLEKGARLGRYPISRRVGMLILGGAAASKKEKNDT
jgi:hypothetical protein